MSHYVFYSTNELEVVKSRLQVILSCEKKEVAKLVKSDFRQEVLTVAEIFSYATNALHHKWAAAILGSVPLDRWVEGIHGERHIEPSKEASLRLWSPELPKDLKENLIIGNVRKEIFNKLLNSMPAQTKKHYKDIFTWVNDPSEAPFELASGPLGSDTVFGSLLIFLEKWMDAQLQESEKLWLFNNDWPTDKCVPPEITRELSLQALEHCQHTLSTWLDEDTHELTSAPDSLLALISANLSANRALLEFAATDARGHEAASLAIDILNKLNRLGIIKIPSEIYNITLREAASTLLGVLKILFGHGGKLISPDSDFKRPMSNSDIYIAVKRSLQLQENYIATRGSRGGPIHARENHGKSHNLFIFCLTMIGAFYANSKTANEFKGKSNSSYAVFPARSIKAADTNDIIPIHADELLKQAYGQIYFGNIDNGILAAGVIDHAKTASIKRAHIQQLIFFTTKNRPSSCLLKLAKRFLETKENFPLMKENIKTVQHARSV